MTSDPLIRLLEAFYMPHAIMLFLNVFPVTKRETNHNSHVFTALYLLINHSTALPEKELHFILPCFKLLIQFDAQMFDFLWIFIMIINTFVNCLDWLLCEMSIIKQNSKQKGKSHSKGMRTQNTFPFNMNYKPWSYWVQQIVVSRCIFANDCDMVNTFNVSYIYTLMKTHRQF